MCALSRSWNRGLSLACLAGLCFALSCTAADSAAELALRSPAGAEAFFERTPAGLLWLGLRHPETGVVIPIAGPRFSIQTPDGFRATLADVGMRQVDIAADKITFEADFEKPPVTLRQEFSFCGDGTTLRVRSAVRARGDAFEVQRYGLLELQVPGESFRLTGPGQVSCPVYGTGVFAGLEHPSAWCQAQDDQFWIARHVDRILDAEWQELPPAIFGIVRAEDQALAEAERTRHAFLRYLDTVRVKPADLHVHYNDWWTAPVPSSQEFVLSNIAALKAGLYDTTGFFFDSYALDAGWSDPHSVWEMDTRQFPQRFAPIRTALESIGSHVGLWISPSSLYPFALDNNWLKENGYEVMPHPSLGFTACLAKGGRYQQAFKDAALRHAREANLAHMKFDGIIQECNEPDHGHAIDFASRIAIADGLIDVLDALRAQNPNMALEPTCFGYNPSPWWLMHTPFIIGPFGDDSPRGRVPCPEWIEAMTTARDIENLNGRASFQFPSSALQCFDIIVQCPGPFQNHAVMAIGRGRWFISSYINPKYMDTEEWRFFADLIKWARYNREFLQEPRPIGGNPEQRMPYGYAFSGPDRALLCLRNPFIVESDFLPPADVAALNGRPVDWRMIYPRQAMIARGVTELPAVHLGPFETVMVEVTPTETPGKPGMPMASAVDGGWAGSVTRAAGHYTLSGDLRIEGASSMELAVLCEGGPAVAKVAGTVQVDNAEVPVTASTSEGAFSATGKPQEEHWTWLLATVEAGENAPPPASPAPGTLQSAEPRSYHLEVDVILPVDQIKVRAFIRGTAPVVPDALPETNGPRFPLYQPNTRCWARELQMEGIR